MRSPSIRWSIVPLLVVVAPLLVARLTGQEQRGDRRLSRGRADRVDRVEDDATPREGTRPFLAPEQAASLNGQARARSAPFLLPRADGSTTLGYLEFSAGPGDRGDRIVLATLTPENGESARRVVSETPAEIVRPVGVVDGRDRVRLFWTELVEGSPQLRTAVEGGPPVTLTRGAPHMNVEATLHPRAPSDGPGDDPVWIAYETETPPAVGADRGSRDVYAARVGEDGVLAEPIRVGDGPFSDLDPRIVSAGGRLWIAWVGYTGRDYELRLRSLDPATGALSPVLEVSADLQSDDVHPSLVAARDGDLWLAWDRIENSTRGSSIPRSLRLTPLRHVLSVDVCVARVRDGRVEVPPTRVKGVRDGAVEGAPLLSVGGGVPRLAFDAAGRLWIAYHHLFRDPDEKVDYSFPVLLQSLGAEGWSAPIETDRRSAGMEEPALCAAAGGMAAAFSLGVLGIGIARASAPAGAPTPSPLIERVANLDAPHFHPLAAQLDDPIVTGARHFEVARGGASPDRWQVYWGDLHRHSSVSRCSLGLEPGPIDRWEWGRDIHLCDFMALTDHSSQIDPFHWWALDKLCWLFQSPTFCTLAGVEWSSKRFGHHNVIFAGRMTPLVNESFSLEKLYDQMNPGDCVTIPHHSSNVRFPVDFPAIDDRFTRLIEVYQACRGSYEFDGCFLQDPSAEVVGCFVQDALNDGHRFGIVASTDHGFGQAYACVLAKSLARADVFEALQSRRTYGATTKGMLVDLRIDDAVMGEAVTCAAPPRIRLHARGAAELADVVLFRNGRIWKSLRGPAPPPANASAPHRFVARLPADGETPRSDWTLTVRAEGANLVELRDRRECWKTADSPSWTVDRGEATFLWPRGFAPTPDCTEFALHVVAIDSATFTLRSGEREQTATYAELLTKPVVFQAPSGPCAIAVSAGDAVIDLGKGLGTRDFDAEWVDAGLQKGLAWYYARIVQTDGQVAWSSPIFVRRS